MRKLFITLVLIFSLFSFPAMAKNNVSLVKSWGYWLQNTSIDAMLASPYDLFVIDYSKDGTDAGAFSAAEIKRLKADGRIVLCYFSIGEAEDYRFYWKNGWKEGNPEFLGPENLEWKGNYKVKYWNLKWWQQALKPYLDKILAAGFDGVYLDIIDGYYYWGNQSEAGMTLRADEMCFLVNEIGEYARKTNKDFIVCPQNGESILDDASEDMRDKYIKAIDCIGIEDLFFNYGDAEDQKYRMKLLGQLEKAGKMIFNIEYVNDSQRQEYFKLIDQSPVWMIRYPSSVDRALDKLTNY